MDSVYLVSVFKRRSLSMPISKVVSQNKVNAVALSSLLVIRWRIVIIYLCWL